MTTAARFLVALTVCSFLALYGVIAHKRTVPAEANYWLAAGCDELCLQHGDGATPRISTMDFSELFR
jgi:hypothetical protein